MHFFNVISQVSHLAGNFPKPQSVSLIFKKEALFLIFFLLMVFICHGQKPALVQGFVIDESTKLPISDVEVILENLRIGTISESNGKFELEIKTQGKYFLVFKHIAYKNKRLKITISDKLTNVNLKNIFLFPKIENLNEVIVRDKISEEIPYLKITLGKKEIEEKQASGVGDFLRSVPNVSGIRKGGSGIDPVVRGFKFSQLNVLANDGLKIEGGCPNRMDPTSSHINIYDINKIEIIKGPFALRYGPSFGGVINMKTLQPQPFKKFSLKLNAMKGFESNYDGTSERIAIKGGNKKFYFIVSGNKKEYRNYTDGNGEKVKSEFEKYDYSIGVGAKITKKQEIKLYLNNSFGRNVLFPALPMDERSDDTRLLSANYNILELSENIKNIKLKIYNSDVKHIMDNKNRPFSDTVVAISSIHAIKSGYRAEVEMEIGKIKLFAGSDFENTLKDGDRKKYLIKQPGLPVKTEKLWNDAEINNLGFFSELSTTHNDFEYVAAFRLDYNKAGSNDLILKTMNGKVIYSNPDVDSDFINFSLSGGLRKYFSEKFSVMLSAGRGVRSPDMVERFIILLPVGYDNFDYLGNPKLKPEKNNELDLSLRFENHNFGIFELNGFYSYVEDFISSKMIPPSEIKPQTKDVAGVKQFCNLDNVSLFGFEFAYKNHLSSRLELDLKAAITRGINPETVKYIIENKQVVAEEKIKNDPLPEIPPFEASLDFSYKFFNSTFIPNVNFRFVAAQNNISEAFYESKTPGFALMNLRFLYKYNTNFSISGGVKNVFNTAYYEHLNRRIIGSDKKIFEPGRVFFINLFFEI